MQISSIKLHWKVLSEQEHWMTLRVQELSFMPQLKPHLNSAPKNCENDRKGNLLFLHPFRQKTRIYTLPFRIKRIGNSADVSIYEKDLLGFYISGHPLTSYEKDIQTLTNLNTLQYKKLVKSGKRDELRSQDIRMIGIVEEVKLIKDKKKELWLLSPVKTCTTNLKLFFSQMNIPNSVTL